MEHNAKQQWEEYRERELLAVTPVLHELGFVLDDVQVHTAGERFLMVGKRDVGGGGYKLVLTGVRTADQKPVVLKVSSDPKGKEEILTERLARETLLGIKFAYHALFSPEEFHFKEDVHTILATEYIPQDKNFLDRPIEKQFSLALRAFKAQEGVHATTYSHAKVIGNIFGVWDAVKYLNSFEGFRIAALKADPHNAKLTETFAKGAAFLELHREIITQYCGFLTHADFVPHNMRVVRDTTYLLDSASLHFGNKYESWARFLNFMLLYNRPLEEALVQYVKDNRTPEESLSLRLMRIYKLGKLLEYHTSTLAKTTGDMHTLSKKRIEFWRVVMESLLTNTRISDTVIEEYKRQRDILRSEEEKNRQKELH